MVWAMIFQLGWCAKEERQSNSLLYEFSDLNLEITVHIVHILAQKFINMAHVKVKIWIHAVWGVKYRRPLIHCGVEEVVHSYLVKQFNRTGCSVEAINGTEDHVHVLFKLHPECTIRKVMQMAKGGSSFALKKKGILPSEFYWQVGYGAFSVSESQVDTVRAYIDNQKVKHKMASFDYRTEYKLLLDKHGLPFLPVDNEEFAMGFHKNENSGVMEPPLSYRTVVQSDAELDALNEMGLPF